MLRFPSAFCEAEFGKCRRYLPETIELTDAQLAALAAGRLDGPLADLAGRRALLELPEAYL